MCGNIVEYSVAPPFVVAIDDAANGNLFPGPDTQHISSNDTFNSCCISLERPLAFVVSSVAPKTRTHTQRYTHTHTCTEGNESVSHI